MGISITTEHGTDNDGKRVYSAEEHSKLQDATGRMTDEQFQDWLSAPSDGRVRSADQAAKAAPVDDLANEVKKARRDGDTGRLNELQQMAADGRL